MSWKTVPIPERMQKLDRDARGYPVPFNILRDDQGKPHFTINDHAKARRCILERRCPICGDEHDETLWFAGGPLSALHAKGAYFDQPMHAECVHYAMQVCPYLAAPKYTGRIDTGTLKPDNLKGERTFLDPTVMPERPDLFLLVEAKGYSARRELYRVEGKLLEQFYLKPTRPYVRIEHWMHGRQLTQEEATRVLPGLGAMLLQHAAANL